MFAGGDVAQVPVEQLDSHLFAGGDVAHMQLALPAPERLGVTSFRNSLPSCREAPSPSRGSERGVDRQSPRGERHSHPVLRRPSPRRVLVSHAALATFVDGLQLSQNPPPWEPDSHKRCLNFDDAVAAAATKFAANVARPAAAELAANVARPAAVEAEPGVPGVACVTGTPVSGGAAAVAAVGIGPTGVAADKATSAAPTYAAAAAVAAQALTTASMPLVSSVDAPSKQQALLPPLLPTEQTVEAAANALCVRVA